MAEKKSKVIGGNDALQKKIVAQWRQFSKTEAYKDLMAYGDTQRDMLLKYAEEMAMPHPGGHGVVAIDGKMANYLLQNRRGIGIMTTYIRLRSE